MTRFAVRTKVSLRESLLDAAADLLPGKGYAGLRMADVAARTGVSRQTVYNEFGSKAALVQAVALRINAGFLDGIRERFEAAGDVRSGIHATIAYTVANARENPLVAAALGTGTETAEDLLPLLTTRGKPILDASTEVCAANLRERVPELRPVDAALVAETIVRLALSHLVLPTHEPAEAADSVCATVLPALEHFSGSPLA
ncbi:TetR family transcriptional regulator [Amycolatopsis sp. CA-230715]|uniref:TetR family transcriptional regulator n=1 Tax=Amycolatopsis sp. CA-230715 TaxID=2745196 RepID=UPI001C016F31|nr:TetR family transcriptional regulator [Amycolatopsis sp. CA-230715]